VYTATHVHLLSARDHLQHESARDAYELAVNLLPDLYVSWSLPPSSHVAVTYATPISTSPGLSLPLSFSLSLSPRLCLSSPRHSSTLTFSLCNRDWSHRRRPPPPPPPAPAAGAGAGAGAGAAGAGDAAAGAAASCKDASHSCGAVSAATSHPTLKCPILPAKPHSGAQFSNSLQVQFRLPPNDSARIRQSEGVLHPCRCVCVCVCVHVCACVCMFAVPVDVFKVRQRFTSLPKRLRMVVDACLVTC
jgi:hypothetical protein